MRIDYRLFFSVLLVLSACESAPERPADILPEDQMAVVLANVHYIDGEMFNIPQQQDSLYKYGLGHYLGMFKRLHTDSAQFRKSFVWYTRHPVQFDAVYDDVLQIIQKKSDSLTDAQNHGDTAKVKTAPPVQ